MANKQQTAQARIENIKTNLRSLEHTTTRTLNEIRLLLDLGSDGIIEKENTSNKALAARSSRPTARRKGATTGATASAPATKQSSNDLTPRDRYIFATEVANTTLKTLSDALRATPTAQSIRKSQKSNTTTEDVAPQSTKCAPQSQRPLQELSADQATNARIKSKPSPGQGGGSDAGLPATAECARAAFAYLRTAEAMKIAGTDGSPLQLENGMLALVGKLVTHGLDNIALKELRILKKRLEKVLGVEEQKITKSQLKAKAPQRTTTNQDEKVSIASLLDFGEVDRKSPALSIVISHQIYTLRIIARMRRPQVIEESWTSLKLSNPGSPANLTWYAAQASKGDARAIRQLESLAQTILSMCPSVSTSEDLAADDSNVNPTPDTVLSLQHLAFKTRQRWWTLAGHKPNDEKELLEPLSKCLNAFARRSRLSFEKRYKIAKLIYTDLNASEDPAPQSRSAATLSASRILGDLAQAAGQAQEALQWLGNTDTSTTEHSAARAAARLARAASLSIDASVKGSVLPELEASIAAAQAALENCVEGSATALEAVFIEAQALRRVVSRALAAKLQSEKTESGLKLANDVVLNIVKATLAFSIRFLATPKPDNVPASEQWKQRVNIASKHMRSIVDTVCVCSKLPITTDPDEHLTSIKTIVTDCSTLLGHFGEGPDEARLTDDLQCPFVKLSNAYWALHVQLKAVHGLSTATIAAMQLSIGTLQERSLAERRSGMITMKYERLADALEAKGDDSEASTALFQCIQDLIEAGMLQDAASLASTQPIRQPFELDSTTSVLGRILKSYHRSVLKRGLKNDNDLAFFDQQDLSSTDRGALLEWQLALYLKTLSRHRTWDAAFNPSVRAIGARLMDLYDPSIYPIRHRRAYGLLIRLAQEHPGILSLGLLPEVPPLDPKTMKTATEDHGLLEYAEHLDALVRLKFSIMNAVPQIEELRQCLIIWHNFADSLASWQAISAKVDDTEEWLEAMETTVNYLLAKGEEYFCLSVLQLIVKLLVLQGQNDRTRLVTSRCTLAILYLRLGYAGKAGQIFALAETTVKTSIVSTEGKLTWYIAYAEYLLSIGNLSACEHTLSDAEELARSDTDFNKLQKSSTSLSERLRSNTILADACYVHSLHAAKNGYLKDAGRYAKQCVALNRRTWAALESRSTSDKSKFDPTSSVRTESGGPSVMSTTHDSLDGRDLWSLVPSLFRGLLQQSVVYAQQGLLQEAVYFAEQAEKIALATKSQSFLVEVSSLLAQYWAQSGRVDKAQAALKALEISASYKHSALACYYSSVAWIAQIDNETDAELAAYEQLDRLLEDLTAPEFLRSIDASPGARVDELTDKLSTLALEAATDAIPQGRRPTRGRKPASKSTEKPAAKPKAKPIPRSTSRVPKRAVKAPLPDQAIVTEEFSPLLELRADVARRKALAELSQNNTAEALKLVELAQTFVRDADKSALHMWVNFKALISRGMEGLSRDVTLNTLPESTIAFPAIGSEMRRMSESLTTRRVITTAAPAKGVKSKSSVKEGFIAVLQEARERLLEYHALCTQAGSSFHFQQASLALGQVTVLLSAVSGGNVNGSVHPGYAAYMSEIPKCNALRHSQQTIEVEKESLSRDECLKWPDLEDRRRFTLASPGEFQRQYIDIIPESWAAIALALNETHDELYITRYEAGRLPFVLRLPVARHTSRDMDEEEFSFQDGKRELEEIIELSDFSTRSAKDMTSKQARLQWWAEREALDKKLEELLINIENIWLGGFRGIFSQNSRSQNSLARFRKAFDNILNRHLPSRRGKGRRPDTALDAGVLELFIGLGDANNEEVDLDEPLTDLVYFVVDILQFNGERNAYDEIDFDAIVIETLDALRAYHSDCQNLAQGASKESAHTILILDNNLHTFPWESLPSLQSLSISRLPSLAALRERIVSAKQSRTIESAPAGHYISAESGGTSILNPSGDLSHTLKTLKPRLDDLQGPWAHINNRGPSEQEFEAALKQKELVLYFGHGSGAQYVRSKSVRRLYTGHDADTPACATTFLFGCSSVHLSENGIYEPSGMLASYLTAGAPAVVGMLWDVTDKDCDRFAIKAGECWGLWQEKSEAEEAAESGKKGKGKGKVAQFVADVESARATTTTKKGRKARAQGGEDDGPSAPANVAKERGVGLDEAVRIGREACVLRYLNGAAAVMYGIPVYLE
ncbi:hypothetical protein BU24DRAFT_384489 [Aaosphaeria arxii CBS 175.79]|uniref:separase n=1 Tax=Aaosphaeria arxii CBS 175.79 TaxID=1450172 RepID=A0A6A5Y8X2_9PLEO|nr:uncharacterized protein BU24DRAFT_384489 [Aaosphaeria arxii CBS 175.79]KAF2022052.1 hypothetical protein BU24DRAFT_384489 [Aaosphaeria arxii CBS 175.79]